jgi:aminopeptidase N
MKIVLTLLLIGAILNSFAQHQCGNSSHAHAYQQRNLVNNMRSDTLDVLDYKVYLDITDFDNKIIHGHCRVKFTAKMNDVSGISLDLLQLDIDSVKQGNSHITFFYNDTLLRAQFIGLMNEGEVDSVTVYYRGQPQGDPSGWGGFYFQGPYAYNLGVGFEANPHNYGRVWHPCFDNFVERATYEITVRTTGTKRAYSNGYIAHEVDNSPAEMIRTWKLDDPIPTYLACVGVSDYVHVSQSYESPIYNTTIPSHVDCSTSGHHKFQKLLYPFKRCHGDLRKSLWTLCVE